MASRGSKRKGKRPDRPPGAATTQKTEKSHPAAHTVAPRRVIAPHLQRRGLAELTIGAAIMVVGIVIAMGSDAEALSVKRFALVMGLWAGGLAAIALGATRLDPRAELRATNDLRRWIYGELALLFALLYALLMWKVIPNRLPSAMMHLSTVPLFTLLMATGTLLGGRFGWWLGVLGGSMVLLSTIVLIARILASAAFLAGVYGAFGKAASTFALVSVALIVELVGILPICQVKFLMTRRGRRAFGV